MDNGLPLIVAVACAVFLTCLSLVVVVAVIALVSYASDKAGTGKPSVYSKRKAAPLLDSKDVGHLAVLVPVTAIFGIFGGLFYILLWDD